MTKILKQFKESKEHNPYRITEYKETNGESKNLKENKTIYIESQEQISELWNLLNEVADGESFINSRNQVIEDEN